MEKVEGGKHAEAFDISALPAKPKRNSCRWGWLDTRKLQIVGLCMVILITWGLLCLPVVFYHQRTREVTTNAQCEPYTGSSACAKVYQCAAEAARTPEQEVFVFPHEGNQRGADTYISLLVGLVGNASLECQIAALPFACQVLLPPCTSSDDVVGAQPTAEQCITTYTLCAPALIALKGTEFASLLPDCSKLSAGTVTPVNSTCNDTPSSTPEPTQSGNNDTVCREDFTLVDGMCMARCDSWSQFPNGVRTVVRVFLIFSICAVNIGSILVIVLSCVRWKAMFTFPSIFLVLMTLSCLIMGIFVMVVVSDQKGLFCHELSVLDAVEHPTAFCIITGIVWQYFLINLTALWLSHICCIFWKVMFPLHAREHRRRQKYLYAILTIASYLVPVPSVMAALLSDGYAVNRFPPLLCGVKDLDIQYYSLWLVINILWGVGTTLLIIMFWKIHRHQGLFRKTSKDGKFSISTAEKKLLFVFIYYILFTAITLIYYSVLTRDHAYFINEVEKYFLCELVGYNPDNPCPKNYEQYTYGDLEAAAYVLMGFIPVINLIFVLHFRELKVGFSKLCRRECRHVFDGSSPPSMRDTDSTFERNSSVRNCNGRSSSFSSCTAELVSLPTSP